MITKLFKLLFGSRNERVLKRMRKIVQRINQHEPTIQALSDTELQAKTPEFRERLVQGETLDDLLPEAFAVVREASVRTLKMRHFDVQLIGGIVLHEGRIAEMKTGEGKTLAATLPAYLNALSGHGVHIVTVNEYLAARDAEWMRPIYEFLGLTVTVIRADMNFEAKSAAYRGDVSYTTNNELGFDYLRDNMAFDQEGQVQRALPFAIVDEVDSILIDEARTPLIISGPAEESSELYQAMNTIAPQLLKREGEEGPGDFYVDEKTKQAYLTEIGHSRVEVLMAEAGLIKPGDSLYSATNIIYMHHLNAALRAHYIFQRDVDYIIQNKEVMIVDEHTGRIMSGRRWSDGLHQAIEAKEGMAVQSENQTLASITFQNYFRLYDKLAGMTGTADTEAYEFQQIYNLEVIVIPTNKPMQRTDHSDKVYLTTAEKFTAIVEDIKQCRDRLQPVLVGTASIETSELLSALLKREQIPHQVLNAKLHEKEAHIITQAGKPASVTIATNMAGRGTDIVLGGSLDPEIVALGDDPDPEAIARLKTEWQTRHDQVLKAGGLHIIGSERHESRRIDNQLRGRSGRQGDPGSSQFYLSLEDSLLRIFASDRMAAMMGKLGMGQGEAIAHPWVTKAIENAQRKVEGHHFDIRKELLAYDDVANDQRRVIYTQRAELLQDEDIAESIAAIRHEVLDELVDRAIPPSSMEEQWDVASLTDQLTADFGLSLPLQAKLDEEGHFNEDTLREYVLKEVEGRFKEKEDQLGSEMLRNIEKAVMLEKIDTNWREHLAAMDCLRQGIHLRGYAQKNPKQEYKREAFQLFSAMLDKLHYEVISTLCLIEVQAPSELDAFEMHRHQMARLDNVQYQHADYSNMAELEEVAVVSEQDTEGKVIPFIREERKIGRNESCPCGSGMKYKNCHGKL